ncbi:MAG: sulfurtransferase [Burkholderiales bacterium PBB4]|nr:MAG: sulfurtransferase [Burkholderiales bacterium PBB4]
MIEQIRPGQLAQWLQAQRTDAEPIVLDVREPHELQLASVQAQGFQLVTIPMGVLPVRLHELNPQHAIACLCHHGGRSMQVAAFLQSRGFAHVVNIAGGIDAWSTEVDPSIARY